MNKRRLCIYLGSVGLIVVGLVILCGFAIGELRKHPPLWYYDNFKGSCELPTRLIRQAFQELTDRELPQKADGLRAIYNGATRDPSIFVRFETDSEGIAYILEKFGGRGVKKNTFDVDSRGGLRVQFKGLSSYHQDKIGVRIFDWKDIKSGLELIYSAGIQPSHEILIDEQQNTVYIFAYWQ